MLLKGIFLALTMSLLVGPIFLILLQVTMDKGWRGALYFSFGVWLSDFLYLNFAYFGMSMVTSFVDKSSYQHYMGYMGAIILIIFGMVTFFNKDQVQTVEGRNLKARSIVILGAKGFALNSVNPLLLIFWLGIFASLGIGGHNFWFFVLGFMTTLIGTDLAKIYLAGVLRTKLRPIHFVYIRKIGGIILVAFGLYMLIRTLMS